MLFFLVIELFLGFIFYHYQKIEEEHLKERLFLEMKNYALFFDNEKFDIDIVPRHKNSRFYELLTDQNSLYMLVPFSGNREDLLKIYYPKGKYLEQLNKIEHTILWQFVFLSLIAVLISLLFSFYVLKPLRNTLDLLETFIKDIIHDLNTPLTSILINLKMMDSKNEEVESIGKSAKTIAILHQNLDAYLKESIQQREKFPLREVIEEQVDFFASLYDYIKWDIQIENKVLLTDRNAFARVIYNLLSNAAKYNTSNGFISISTEKHILTISNSSYGITDPQRVFERFYKEGERGLGIGLHIVDKLCKQLNIPIDLEVKDTTVHFHLDLSQVTSN